MERIRKTASNVQTALQKIAVHQPLAVVVAPGELPNSQCKYHQKVELEKACLVEAGHQFTQASNTLLLTSPLIKLFGEYGNHKAMVNVIDGTFSPPMQCNTQMAKFLSAVYQPPTINDILPHSECNYSQGWRKACEMTGSSASGIHFSHYITGTFNPDILIINATMANIPLWTGFAYDRWKKGINVMIKKTNGNFNVEKLRIILLFEADFNANNKWISHMVMF